MSYIPRLNRIVTVKASSISTEESLIPWRFSHYGAEAEGESIQPQNPDARARLRSPP